MKQKDKNDAVKNYVGSILRIGTLFFLIIILGTTSQHKTVHAQDTPIELVPGQCTTDTLSITLGDSPIPQLDVLFLIDLSASMQEVNTNIADNIEQIVQDIRQLVPDASFGLATFVDFPGRDRDPDIYPWRYNLPFTTDVSVLQSELNDISQQSFFSGEAGESYLYALRETTRSVTWRPEARRIVILVGDASPHQPGDIDVPEWLEQDDIVNLLVASDITVLSIYTRYYAQLPDHLNYFNNVVQPFFQSIAADTGGRAFLLDNFTQVPSAVQQVIAGTVTNIQSLTLDPGFTGQVEVNWDPVNYTDVAAGQTYSFDVEICAPVDAGGGSVSFQILGLADGAVVLRAQQNLQIPGPTVTPTLPPTATSTPLPTPTPTPMTVPIIDTSADDTAIGIGIFGWLLGLPGWVYLIPVFLLLLLLFWWWKNRRTPSNKVAPPPRRRGVSRTDTENKTRIDPGVQHGRGRRRKK